MTSTFRQLDINKPDCLLDSPELSELLSMTSLARESSLLLLEEDGAPIGFLAWRPLVWESEIFSCDCRRIDRVEAVGDYRLARRRKGQLLAEMLGQSPAGGFVSFRFSASEVATIHAAEDAGLRLAEDYVTLSAKSKTATVDARVRFAAPADSATAGNIAYKAFTQSRFHADPHFDKKSASESRRIWVQNAFNGRADDILVAEADGVVAGFMLLKTNTDHEGVAVGVIDLIGVDTASTGEGLGSALVIAALDYYAGKTEEVIVGTQATNRRAIDVYQRNGFRMACNEYTFHWHEGKNT